jgi:hypothetical protein
MEAAGSSKPLVTLYQTTYHQSHISHVMSKFPCNLSDRSMAPTFLCKKQHKIDLHLRPKTVQYLHTALTNVTTACTVMVWRWFYKIFGCSLLGLQYEPGKGHKINILHCYCAISGYNGSRLWSINMLHQHKLCSRSQTREQSYFRLSCLFCKY